MFGDNLELVVLRNSEAIQQRLVNGLANLCAILRRLAFEKIDSNQRHAFSFNGATGLRLYRCEPHWIGCGAHLHRCAPVLHFTIRKQAPPDTGQSIRTCFFPRNMWATWPAKL